MNSFRRDWLGTGASLTQWNRIGHLKLSSFASEGFLRWSWLHLTNIKRVGPLLQPNSRIRSTSGTSRKWILPGGISTIIPALKKCPSGALNSSSTSALVNNFWNFQTLILNKDLYLCYLDSPGASPDVEERLNTNAEFCCVIKTRLAGRAMLYGAEVDALRPNSQPPWETTPDNVPTMRNFVELKTTRHIENQRQDVSFRKYQISTILKIFTA